VAFGEGVVDGGVVVYEEFGGAVEWDDLLGGAAHRDRLRRDDRARRDRGACRHQRPFADDRAVQDDRAVPDQGLFADGAVVDEALVLWPTWMTVLSWMFAPARIVIVPRSARITAPYQIDTPASTTTSPTSVAVGAIHASGWTVGRLPSNEYNGMRHTLRLS
jgi:hypothetical protein